MRIFFKILPLTACLLLLAATAAMAFGEIRYPDRPLNLRNARSAKGKWVGSLHPGQKVRVAFLKDGWVAVFEPGENRARESAAVGYSNAKYLKKKQTRVEPKPWGETVYTPRNLNIRSRASVKGKRLGMLKAGDKVKIDFPEGDWTMVFSAKATIRSEMNRLGYCSAKYFKPVKASAGKPAPVKPEPVKPEPKAVEATASVSGIVNAGSGKGQVSSAVAPPPPPVAKQVTAPAPEKKVVAAPEKKAVPTSKVVASKSVAPTSWGKVVTIGKKMDIRKERTSTSRYVRTLKPGEKVRVDFLKNGWYAVFGENEVVRKENRAMGYALRSLIDGDDGSQVIPTPVKAARSTQPEAKEPVGGVKKTMVIDRTRFKKTKRSDPAPNKSAHGYQYRLLEKGETKKLGETWISLKVFLASKKLPGNEALKDFSTTLWKEHRRATKNLAVLIYLPGMDTEDLSYGVIKFDDDGLVELWVRKAALFGTDYL